MAESSGELLGGRYRLLGERTSFPFGAWWEAEDDQGARTVVLRMNAEVADPAAKAKAAVAATAKLESAHVVQWADGGVDAKGHGWLAAPMFGPWSLTEHVTKGEGVPPAEATPLMHQLARAMAAGEAQGLHHNTLTSEFVRLVPLPEGGYGVKVYGFGLSDLLPSYKPLRKQDAYLGVPDYMSPELCSGKAAEGASADIYALGIIMYESVRGRPPFAPTFASASASTTLKRHIFEKPLPLHVRYANAPFIKTYETICFKALAKTANRRHLSVAELEKELELLIVDEMRSQVVSLDAVSGRGPTTSRRLRTQVIAQIPIEEPPKAEVKIQAAPVASVTTKAAEPVVTKAPDAASAGRAPDAASAGRAPDAASAGRAPATASPPAGRAAEVKAEPAKAEPVVTKASEPVKAEPVAVKAAEPVKVADAPEPVKAAAPTVSSVVVEPEPEDEDEPEATPEPMQRRGDSTLVFAGLGPAVREFADAVRKIDEEEDGSGEDDVLPAGATGSNAPRKGKKKKGRKGSTGLQAAVSAPMPEPKPAATTPSAATIVTPKAEMPTGEGPGTAAGAKADLSGARIRKKDEPAPAAAKAKAPAAKGKDEEEWFGDDETTPKKGSKAWIFLLLAAAVVILVIILLMSGGDKGDKAEAPVGTAPSGQRYAMESEPTTPGSGTLTAATPNVPPPSEPAKVAEVAKVEPPKPAEAPPAAEVPSKPEVAKVEPPKPPEPGKIEAPKVEAPKVEAPKAPEPAKVEPTKVDKEPAKVEPAKVEKEPTKVEPTKVEKEPTKVEPAKVEKTDPPGSPEDQFRQKAAHYIQLGMQAYKGENWKLAIGYFKKAQEADPNNIQAARYLKQAQDKLAGQ